MIGCQTFDCVRVNASDTIYLDDEGLFAEPKALWKWGSYPHPFINKALILGTDAEGETAACALDLEYVRRQITWPAIGVIPAPEFYDMDENWQATSREVIGEATVVVNTPKEESQ